MDVRSAEQSTLDTARRALSGLACVPVCAPLVAQALAELETDLNETPLVLGIGGLDVLGRTALLDRMCGGGVLSDRAREPGCAAIRLRRGQVTRFRAIRADGPDESLALSGSGLEAAANPNATGQAPPSALSTSSWVQALWRWVLRLLAWLLSRTGVVDGRRTPAEVGKARSEPTVGDAGHDARRLFFDRLAELASGLGAGVGVNEIELEVASDAMPAGVEVIELKDWAHATASVDAVLIMEDGLLQAPGGISGKGLALRPAAHVVAHLRDFLRAARVLRLARRAREQTELGVRKLDLLIDGAPAEWARRVTRVEELRITDRAAFIAGERARMAGPISATIAAVLEHASAYLGSELAQQKQTWRHAIAKAASTSELRAEVQAIERGAVELGRIHDEVSTLVMGGLGGATRDLHAQLVASLVRRGLPEEHARTPRAWSDVRRVDLLPCLARPDSPKLDDSLSWLTGLVRSIEHRRHEVMAKVDAYADRLAKLARAEMLDAEPRVHDALSDALTQQLEVAIDRQTEWLDRELERVRAEIEAERAALPGVVRQRDATRRDLAALAAAIHALERLQPEASAASAAYRE